MKDTYKGKGLRKKLVDSIRKKGITDEAVLSAIEKVPRHFFLDSAFLEQAYEDKAFPIGKGQTISQPYTVAFQTQALDVKPGDKILEIGTGSGYQASILLEMGAHLFSIERIPELQAKAERILASLGYEPVIVLGDGSQGLPEFAPFDGILVTAAAPKISQVLLDQLSIGGRMVIPVGDKTSQIMKKIVKVSDTSFHTFEYDKFKFVPLIGKEGWEGE
jgi:protein-L-isoaspartate(D-aspartate) O-methyltransferase